MKEATIIIDGHILTEEQAMATRVAVTAFLMQLRDDKFRQGLGLRGEVYATGLTAVLELMNNGSNA